MEFPLINLASPKAWALLVLATFALNYAYNH